MTPEELAERIKASAGPEQAYDLMAAQPMRVRQAAHHALPLASRLALWEVQIDRFAEQNAGDLKTAPKQREAIAFAKTVIRQARNGGIDPASELPVKLEEMRVLAQEAFDARTAIRLFATLGPPEEPPG